MSPTARKSFSHRRVRVTFGTLLATLILSLAVLSGSSAAVAATDCVADASTACFFGTIRDGAAGIEILVEGNGQKVTATTTADGSWDAAVTVAGTYTITLDPKTLPAAVTMKGESTQSRDVTLGARAGVLFSTQTTDASGETTSSTTTTNSVTWDRFLQQAASGLRLGLLLALAAVGLSLIYGTTGLSNFAHAEQVTLGGLLAYVFANVLGLNIYIATIIVVAITAATGYFQDLILWKPLRKKGLSLNQMIIVTIGLALALQYTFQYFIGASTVRILQNNAEIVNFGPVTLTVQSLIAMGVSVVVLTLTGLFLLKTRTGRATRAVSDNPALAAASGIDVDRIIRLVWTIAAGLAGLSGVMLGLVLNGINWMTGMQLLLLLFAAVTLGGLGTAFGALVGSLIIGMTVELTNLVLPGDFKYATALVLLILLLLVRPQGIFGRKERIG